MLHEWITRLWEHLGFLARPTKGALSREAYNWGTALSHKADTLASLGDDEGALDAWQEAERHYAQALQINPGDHQTAYNWGVDLDHKARHLAAQGKHQAALDAWQEAGKRYARALQIKPDMHEAAYNWGNALGKKARYLAAQGKHQAALDAWEGAILHVKRSVEIEDQIQHPHLEDARRLLRLLEEARDAAQGGADTL